MKSFFLLLLFVSCSSMNREQCLVTDWYQKGVEDGGKKGVKRFVEYRRECEKEGVSIVNSSPDYEKGILEGLRSWCTFQNGFNQGLDGRGGTSLCDGINPAFGRGYEEGFREYRVSLRRKRDEEEREKKYSSESEEFRKKILSRTNSKECVVDSDCIKEGTCTFNRCAHNNQYCSYNYECKVKGRCQEVTEYAPDRSLLTIRVCD